MPSTPSKQDILQKKTGIGELFYIIQNQGDNLEGFAVGLP